MRDLLVLHGRKLQVKKGKEEIGDAEGSRSSAGARMMPFGKGKGALSGMGQQKVSGEGGEKRGGAK